MSKLIERINAATLDHSHEPVPDTHTIPSWHIAGVVIAGLICLPAMMIGVTLGQTMRWTDAVIAIVAGQALVAVMISLTAYAGAKSRLPVAILSRITLGTAGSIFVSALIAFSLLGWFGVQVDLFAQAIHKLLQTHFSQDVPMPLLIAGGGVLMSSTAIIGFKALNILSRITIPVMLTFLILPFIQLVKEKGWNPLFETAPENPIQIGTAISMLAGAIAIGMLVSPDITRYARTPSGAIHATWISYWPAGALIFLFSAALSLIGGEGDLITLLSSIGWTTPVLVLLVLGTWTTNDTNIYVAALALTALVKKAKKWMLAIFCGVIGTMAALLGITQYFIPFLILLGIIFAPAAGLLAADYFLNPARYDRAHEQNAPMFRPNALIAWLAGILCGWCTSPKEGMGLDLFSLTTIPALDAILIAAALHTLWTHIARKRA